VHWTQLALERFAVYGRCLVARQCESIDPQRLTDRHDPEQFAIEQALQQFGPEELAGPLAGLLRNERPAVRMRAIDLLIPFGKKARNALPQLMGAMEDKDEDVALYATEAVWTIDRRPEVLPRLMRGLGAKTAPARSRAARILTSLGADAKPAVPALVAACKDRDSAVRREAYRALLVLDSETAKKVGDPEADGR
jgi:HEAT repeat protein